MIEMPWSYSGTLLQILRSAFRQESKDGDCFAVFLIDESALPILLFLFCPQVTDTREQEVIYTQIASDLPGKYQQNR